MRKAKSPLAAWIAGERKRRGWKSDELAARLGVSDSTVRGWESSRTVSADNLAALERLFGLQAPGHDADQGDILAAAIDRVTAALLALVDETRQSREAQQARDETLAELLGLLAAAAASPEGKRGGAGPRLPAVAR